MLDADQNDFKSNIKYGQVKFTIKEETKNKYKKFQRQEYCFLASTTLEKS